MQANYGENEIKSLLQKARIFNKEIGSYQVFAITENFDYAVKLSNGKILLKLEDLQDDEIESLSPVQLADIANRFVSSTSSATSHQQTSQSKTTSAKQKKKTGFIKSNLNILLVIIFIIGVIVIYSTLNQDTKDYGNGNTYQEKVMTIQEIEESQPTNFLSADGNYDESFWGTNLKVHGKITNKATVATYKDALVRVTYYSKTNTVLKTNDYTIYEVFPPTSVKNFELRIENYKNVKTIGWDVIKAVVN